MSTNTTSECDVVVIGGGPGGYVAAIRAAQLGGKVTLIEQSEMGGTCLNKGCIPTKTLLTSSELYRTVATRAKEYGVTVGNVSIDFKTTLARKENVVKTLIGGVESLLRSNGVEIIKGEGSLAGPKEVTVIKADGGKTVVETKSIIIATGTRQPDLKAWGFDQKEVMDTDAALELAQPPKSLLVVGGGPAGVEFATMYAGLGVNVTVAEMLPQILPAEETEIAGQLANTMKNKGIKILTGAKFKGISNNKAVLTTESGDVEVEAEKVLIAFGRILNSDKIGCEKVGVKVEKKRIVIDDKLQTSVPGIYAIGDVIGGLYAHVASEEGTVAAENALGGSATMDYKVVPRCIFTSPEIGAVGMTEKQAEDAGKKLVVGRFPMIASGRALAIGETEGLIKVVTDEPTGEILGVHMIGYRATDLVAEAALAMKLECTVNEVISTIHAHPTMAEAFKEAAMDVKGEAIHKFRPRKRK